MKSGSRFLWGSLFLVLLPEVKLLVQGGPQFPEITLNAGAQFTDHLAKLKPTVSIELLLLLSLSASCAEPRLGTVAPPMCKLKAVLIALPILTLLDKTCIFTDF